MNKRLTLSVVLLLCICFGCARLYGQQTQVHAKNGMTVIAKNYSSFTVPLKDNNPESLKANASYEHHPEIGLLFAETPCDNCYELIAKRSETFKTFIKEGTNGKNILQQTSNAAMHYRDAQGNWRTIIAQLQPDGPPGVYAAMAQPDPVVINTIQKSVSLGKTGKGLEFNNNLELIYLSPNGSETLIGIADWSHYTAGNDGLYVTNAWPGIDIEMHTFRGAVKTNYIINYALPAYANGKLLVRDHMQMANGLQLYTGGKSVLKENLYITDNSGDRAYSISTATAYEKNAAKSTLQLLEYHVNGNTLDIALPGNFLNRRATAYPVIIDPLISASTSSAVSGSTYSLGFTTGCAYYNPATVPANIVVTDIQYSFDYTASGGAIEANGGISFKLGTCRSPTAAGQVWNCNLTSSGTCTSTGGTIFPQIHTCIPTAQCSSYDLNIEMDLYQNYQSDPPCSNLYITGTSPLIITVLGYAADSISGSPTICQAATTTYTDNGPGGTWSSSNTSIATVVAGSGLVTGVNVGISVITYTFSSGCFQTATISVIALPNAGTISGPSFVCARDTIHLNDGAPGGVWSTGAASTVTVSNGGVVTGVSAGTVTISYSVTNSCGTISATHNITVGDLPDPGIIESSGGICSGTPTNLYETVAGGTWGCHNPGVATVSSSGVLTPFVTTGTANIVYYVTNVCGTDSAMANIPILPAPPIGGIGGYASACIGAVFTLSDITAGGTWSNSNSSIITIDNNGQITTYTVGSTTITYTVGPSADGCYGVSTFTFNVSDQGSFRVDSAITPVRCYGETNGSIDLANTTGGSGHYQYYWGGGNNSSSITGLGKGYYTVTISDQITKCNEDMTFYVSQPDSFKTEPFTQDDACFANIGGAGVLVTGENPGYSYQWSNSRSGQEITNLAAGIYTVVITDIKGCTKTLSDTVNEDSCSKVIVHNVITPNGDGYNDTWMIDNIQEYRDNTVAVFDKWGNIVYEKTDYQNDWGGKGKNGELPDGTYFYLVKLNDPHVKNEQSTFTGALLIKR